MPFIAVPFNFEEFGVTDSVSGVVCDAGVDPTTVNDLDVDCRVAGTFIVDDPWTSRGDEAGASSGRRIVIRVLVSGLPAMMTALSLTSVLAVYVVGSGPK